MSVGYNREIWHMRDKLFGENKFNMPNSKKKKTILENEE